MITNKSNFNYKGLFFEDFIINTDKAFEDMMNFLDLNYDRSLYKRLKKINKVPRTELNIVEGYWKRYAENNLSTLGEEVNTLLNRIKGQVRKEYFDILISLIDDYHKFKSLNNSIN